MKLIKNHTIKIEEIENIIEMLKNKTKIPMASVLKNGKYPVISQDKSFISGYTNSNEFISASKDKPLILFGDHTTEVKFVDFNFCAGGDGSQIFKTKEDFDILYLYYAIKNNLIEQSGYKRHFKELKENKIKFPSIKDQIKISNVLVKKDKEISGLKILIEKIELRNNYYADKLMSGSFTINDMKIIEIKNSEYEELKLKNIIDISIGSTPKEEFYDGDIPWITISDLGNENFEDSKKKISKKIKAVEKGSLLISFKLSVGVAKITTKEVCTNEAIIRIEPSKLKENISMSYLYHYLPKLLLKNAGKNAYGANILNTKQINDIDIKIFKNNHEIAEFLNKLQKEKEKVEKILKLEEKRFEWLSDMLLSGEYIIED